MDNMTIFDVMYENYKITKPIRLIEFFAGYGSQAFALKYLDVPFEHWRICEWAVPSIQAYKDAHFTNDNIDYSKCFTKEYIIEFLYNSGISMDYNQPMKLEQIKRMSEEQLRTIYNNILATNNLVNIQKVKGERLDIVEQDKYTYVLTYSFPCQDLSLAGKGKGMSRDGGTRSGMLWEVERILDECNELNCLPQVLLMENVPQVIGEKNLNDFIMWRGKLESLGYSNYVQILNAKDYGMPQNRQRCFMVSILGDYNYTFPKRIPLEKKLKDMLEDNVDEKYYLSDKMINYISANNEKWTGNNGESLVNKTIASTITTGEGSKRCDASNYIGDDLPNNYNIKQLHKTLRETLETNDIESIEDVAYIDAYNRSIRKDDISCAITTRVDASNNSYVAVRKYGIFDKNGKKHQAGSVYDVNGLSPTLDTMNGGWRQPCIEIKEATKRGYKEAYEGDGIDISGRMQTHRGTVQSGMAQTIKTSIDVGVVVKEENLKTKLCNDLIANGKVKENDIIRHSYSNSRMNGEMKDIQQNNISPTLDTRCDCLGVCVNNKSLRIRKLTPKECFRLMGVKDEDYENIAKNQSNSKLYHLAGDSIPINLLMALFDQMVGKGWQNIWNILINKNI